MRGRNFSTIDSPGAELVCILKTSAARALFPTGDAIGNSLMSYGGKEIFKVVGVVEDTRWNGLQEVAPTMIYFPVDQQRDSLSSMQIILRSDNLDAAAATAQQIVHEKSGAQVTEVVTIHDEVNRTLGQPRLLTTLSNFLAGLTLLLSAIATYGLLSYSVKQRTAEIAVRIAVGATRSNVLWMIGRQVLALVLPGIALGVCSALVTTRFIGSLLYQTKPDSPWAFCLSVGTLIFICLFAAYYPARQASAVEPMTVLRNQ